MNIITLTTDFGLDDWFVGTMKGVIATLAPAARIIDLTHGIPAGDIRAGAFALMAAYRFFPRGTIHVAVVDPGVGSDRQAIAVRTRDYLFLGPDNGILSFALQREQIKAIHRLENPRWTLHPVSRTFHGRDLFAPAAAQLSKRHPIRQAGPRLQDCIHLDWPHTVKDEDRLRGEVVYLDRFGNGISNLENRWIENTQYKMACLSSKTAIPLGSHYSRVPKGKPVVVPGSTGFLEIAINGGNASKKLRLRVGSRLYLR